MQDRSFIAEYKARSIVLGKDIEVIQGTNSEKATAIDIDENGGLMIEKQDGTITLFTQEKLALGGTSLHERKIKIYCILSYFMRIVCSFNRSGRVY